MTLRYGTVLNGALSPWVPRELPSIVMPMVTILGSLAAFNRGLDLYRSPTSTSDVAQYTEYLGQTEWGISFMLVALGAALSVTPGLRRNLFVVLTHACAFGVYLGYAATLVMGWWMAGGDMTGSRFPGTAVTAACIWLLWTMLLIRGIFITLAIPPHGEERRHGVRRACDREGEE